MKQKTIELVNFLHQLVIKKKLLKSNQSMILAISGGQDSISLLFIFIQLKNQWNWKLSIIYCNHLWQKDSFYTMLHLFKLSYLLNVPLYLAVTLQKVLTEQKARNWRSLTFQRITGFYLFSVIVTGHSKSDRIETGFFNLFRGSGTQGVGSLNWTKVKIKDNFFKLNKNNLKQISMNYPMLSPRGISSKRLRKKKEKCAQLGLLKSSIRDTPYSFSEKKRAAQDTTSKGFGRDKSSMLPVSFPRRNTECPLSKILTSSYPFAYPLAAHRIKGRHTALIPSEALSETKTKFLVIGLISPVGTKQTKIVCIPSHEEEMSTQIKIRTLSMSDASTNKNAVFIRQTASLTKTTCYAFNHFKSIPLLKGYAVRSKTVRAASEEKREVRFAMHVNKNRGHKLSYRANYIVRGLIETIFLSQFYKNEYILVRPFLSLTRFDLKKICNSWKIPLFPDQSNQKLKYQRNRIRKQILPTLRFFFNPQIDTTLYQFIEIINSEQEYMDFITARIVNEIQIYQKQTIVELETSFINVLPLPIRRKVIKQFLMRFAHKKNLKFFDVEQFLQQISMSCFLKEQKINEKKIKVFETKSLYKEKQKDFLVNIINQKQGKCKLYKLFFFPKTGSIFLQSQRVFFYKKNSDKALTLFF